jgi:2-polyprenyl-6-methoxyphenol hydroxylase-like FAD-dependent oxidoreductase
MREMIRAVAAWYSQQILAERRATVPDQARLEDLVARYRACMADQHALEDEDPQEAARLADRYTALYRELTRQ